MVTSNAMEDRGSNALKSHMTGCDKLEMRQTRRGWPEEALGYEAMTEFKYFIGGTQVFHSLALEDEETVVVKELNTEAEVLTVLRPFCSCPAGPCKCCCYEEASFSSGGAELGIAKETCWFCVPSFKVFDHFDQPLYLIHPPTCCGGYCVNCCAEGNPCGKGCCKDSFRIYPADAADTDGDAPHLGVILKKPQCLATEILTDADTFEIDFPNDASSDQKGVLVGMGILINSVFYETDHENSNDDPV